MFNNKIYIPYTEKSGPEIFIFKIISFNGKAVFNSLQYSSKQKDSSDAQKFTIVVSKSKIYLRLVLTIQVK